jgi:hypothetical protein
MSTDLVEAFRRQSNSSTLHETGRQLLIYASWLLSAGGRTSRLGQRCLKIGIELIDHAAELRRRER